MARLLLRVTNDLGEPSVHAPPFLPPCLGVENLAQERVGEPQAPLVDLEHTRLDRRAKLRHGALVRTDDLIEHAHGRLRARGDHEEHAAHLRRQPGKALPDKMAQRLWNW